MSGNPGRYLLLATSDDSAGERVGYTQLAEHLPDSTLVTVPRRASEPIGQRLVSAVVRRLACSRWYRACSLELEWLAWRATRRGFDGPIHYLWGERDWSLLARLPLARGNPRVATFHGCPDELPDVLPSCRRQLTRLDALILMSEVQRGFFESMGVARDRIHVIHHGVDCSYFQPGPLPMQARRKVLFVGNHRRNFALLKEVCARLGANPEIQVEVIAPKERRMYVDGLANVTFLSDVSGEDLRSRYRDAMCLLMTAESATANNAILEAMASGLPIVSENVGGIGEYARPDCAILCKPGSAEDLVAGVTALRSDPHRAASLGTAARRRASELDWPVVARRTTQIYESLNPHRPAGSPEGEC